MAPECQSSFDVFFSTCHFTGFDREAVEAVLAQLVPERLHVWEIDQAQPVSESLYFYEGQYAVEPLAVPDARALKSQTAEYQLALPAQNRLLPEQFELANSPKHLRFEQHITQKEMIIPPVPDAKPLSERNGGWEV